MSESNKKNDPVVVTCYGNTETWESRAEAMAFYLEAMDMVKKNPDDFSLPVESYYVDGSFVLSTDDAEIMKIMCKTDEM